MEHKKQNSFVLYTDYIQHVSLLSDQEAGQLFKALFRFVAEGTAPDFSGSLMMCFSFISSQIQRDKAKYSDICEKRAAAGSKGGKQKQANLANANFVKQKQANLADTENVTDIENITDTEINYICSLLNQAKAAAGSKGRLKPSGSYGLDDLCSTGVNYAEMEAVAKELAESGKDVDCYSFRDILRAKKTKGGI